MIDVSVLDNMSELKSEMLMDVKVVRYVTTIKDTYQVDVIPYDNGDIVIPENSKELIPNILLEYMQAVNKKPIVKLADETKMKTLCHRYEERQNHVDTVEKDESPAMKKFIEVVQRGWHLKSSDVYIRLIYSDNGKIDTAFAQYRVSGQILEEKTYYLANYDEGFQMLSAFFNYYSESGGQDDFSVQSKQAAATTVIVKDLNGQEKKVRIRAEKNPTNRDDKEIFCVLRLLDPKIKTFEELGTPDWVVDTFDRNINADKGIIITSGPTGSGKSTLVLASLMNFPSNKSLQTIENPVEYELPSEDYPNVIQNSLKDNEKIEEVVKRLLRQKPDALFIGEVSNYKTAELAMDFAKTGHLCMATLHANSATAIPSRLISMNVNLEDLVTPGVLRLLIAQRLYQKVCTSCRQVMTADEMEYFNDTLGTNYKKPFYKKNHKGCPSCNSGVSGVKAYIEMIEIGVRDLRFIKDGKFEEWRHYLHNKGVKFIEDQVLDDLDAGHLCGTTMLNILQNEQQEEDLTS